MLLAGALAVLAGALHAQPARLPRLGIDAQQTSVSGLSSGGYMAVQFHVAHSSTVVGSGVVAGGPYFCAQDDQTTATSVCSCTGLGSCRPDGARQLVPALVEATRRAAQQGRIDPVDQLADSRVWLFSGRLDSVVPPPVTSALRAYYEAFVPASAITLRSDIAAEHAMPTDDFGNACSFRGDPFINDCDFDAAGELLKWIHGPLNPRASGALSGRFVEFDQSEFSSDPTAHGLSRNGWAYLPARCEQGARCRVHIVFHGCRQYPDHQGPQGRFGDTFVRHAGYNAWADTNDIVVLYPQANAMTSGTRLPRSNPLGCWDWWGYDDAAYATKAGRQIAAVKGMVDRLAGDATTPPPPPPPPPPPEVFCGRATNAQHAAAGRAYAFFWWYFARGSNDFLGFALTSSTLRETAPGTFDAVSACG